MTRTVLVVDDNALSRAVLVGCLESEYGILEAENGRDAMKIIRRQYNTLSAVLLDLMMPVMDGFEVLRQIREDRMLMQLPVIVVTGAEDDGTRLRALQAGANDFIRKPSDPEIIRHCLRNTVALREAASIVNALQKDRLTGTYNREYFFEKAGELLTSHKPGTYILACLDIDNFKLVNDQFGANEGDRILKHIGVEMQRTFDEVQGICGRISGDNFAVLFPNTPEALATVTQRRESSFIPPNTIAALHFSVGRYVVSDTSLPVSALYDRAYIAKQSVKGRYDKHVAYFDDSMLHTLVLEQQIIGEMDRALAEHEFEVWLQPQYNHATGALVGAEALVRWRHPERGLILPGSFIPIFEKNGFIYELDKYVWEESCRCLRSWLNQGRDPLPVSVNISRYDIFREDMTELLTGLLHKYSLPVSLLRVEITESAFSESSEQIIDVVKRLIELGFTVEIDDFGSGYSSLNTLKDVPSQVLKLDMRFLERDESAQRGGSILESIIRMSRWLGMAVIAEGVETREQADFLVSIGCNYVQGYFYGRPMPVEQYEALALETSKESRLVASESVVNFNSDSFWDPKSMDTLIFNSFVGGACIFELCRYDIELLRINESYIDELGIQCEKGVPLSILDPFNYVNETDRAAVRAAMEVVAATGAEQTCELRVYDGGRLFASEQYIRCIFRAIAKAGERYLIYCVISNITRQRKAEQAERQAEMSKLAAAKQLQGIMDNIDGGVTATINRNGVIEYIFANDQFYQMLGRTKEEYEAAFSGSLISVHPEDRMRVAALAAKASQERRSYSVEYRIIRPDGAVRWLKSSVSLMELPSVDEPVQLAVVVDITEQAEAKQQLEFLNAMAHELLAQPDAEEGLNTALRRLREYFEGDRAYIFEFDFEKETASNTYEACAPNVAREKRNYQSISLEHMAFWLKAFERQDYYSVEDVSALGEDRTQERESLSAQGISSIFAVPLYRDGRLIGIIGIDNARRRFAQMNHMAALGDYIAVMLTRRDLSSQIVGEDRQLLLQLRKPGRGFEETLELDDRRRRLMTPRGFIHVTLIFCAAVLALLLLASPGRAGSRMNEFAEDVVELSRGWTLTDSAGVTREISLPLTIDYGTDGEYTLTGALPEDYEGIAAPALCIYSNYVDMYAELDGEPVLEYPDGGAHTQGATGNTYHYIRLLPDYAGKTLTVKLRCQLGDSITYLLKPPILGSKATMLRRAVEESMPSVLLSGCLLILAMGLGLMYLVLRRRLELNCATAYTSIFASTFAVYIFCETSLAQILLPNPYALFTGTLMLLSLIPLPLVGLFSEEVSGRYRSVPMWLMLLCACNFVGQCVLHYMGVLSYRVMLPATHAVIIISISVMVMCLLLSDRQEKPRARLLLLTALPMIAGGMADILLLMVNKPSFNNSLWFTLGVTAFIAIQFCSFVYSFFIMYRTSLEAGVLRDMAFRDTLTNMGNRNAYERKLKELSAAEPMEEMCCVVVDINDLKRINDRYGHAIGDAALVETGRLLQDLMPENAFCYRTGGDEFIVLIQDTQLHKVEKLTEKLTREAEHCGGKAGLPLSLAVGCGSYSHSDGNILDFIRRIDALMYKKKQEYKNDPSYPFRS